MRYLLSLVFFLTATTQLSAAARSQAVSLPDTLKIVSQVNNSRFSIAEGDKIILRTQSQDKIRGTLEEVGPDYVQVRGKKVFYSEIDEVLYYPPRVRIFRTIVMGTLGITGVVALIRIILDYRENRQMATTFGLRGIFGLFIQLIMIVIFLLFALLLFVISLGIITLVATLFSASTLAYRKRFRIPSAYRLLAKMTKQA